MADFSYRNFEGFGFDFDGTLANSRNIHADTRIAAYEALAVEFGDERYILSEEIHAVAHNYGTNSHDINAWILHQAGIISDPGEHSHPHVLAIVERKNLIYKETITHGHDEIPGATAFVKKLFSLKPGKSGIGTTAHDWEVMPFLRRHGLNGYFPKKLVVTSEDVARLKPDPEVYEILKERIGIKLAENMLVFEDTPKGIEAAKRAGATVLAIATSHTREELATLEGHQKPDGISEDYKELSAMVI